MKKVIFWIAVLILVVTSINSRIYCQTKLAQTGFQFLSVTCDARAAAIGEAMTTIAGNSSSLFFNPAAMANMTGFFDVSFSQNQWIADINYNAFSFAVNPANGKYGTLGISVVSVDYNEVQGTMYWNNQQGYVDTELMSPSALAIGLGYARALSDRFSVGGQIRTAYQSLGKSVIPEGSGLKVEKNIASVVSYDFGTLFKTGIKSLTFGMSVRNFSKEIKYSEESFQLPLTFTIGLSMNLMDLATIGGPNQALLLSIDATHPRSHPEQLKFGLDYRFIDILSLRGGYISNNDENAFAFGVGISYFGLTVDYAYTPFGVFDKVQRISFRISK